MAFPQICHMNCQCMPTDVSINPNIVNNGVGGGVTVVAIRFLCSFLCMCAYMHTYIYIYLVCGRVFCGRIITNKCRFPLPPPPLACLCLSHTRKCKNLFFACADCASECTCAIQLKLTFVNKARQSFLHHHHPIPNHPSTHVRCYKPGR